MNLVTRFLAARRDRLLMRLGCWLVCFSLVLGLMVPYQRTKALAAELTMVAVASAAAAYLGACGLGFITKNMDKDALVSSAQRLIQEFLDTELGGISIQDWLGNVWDLTVVAGKLFLGRPLTEEFLSFAQWVVEQYATQVGENQVYYVADTHVVLQDGRTLYFSTMERVGSETPTISAVGSVFNSGADFPIVFSTGYYYDLDPANGKSAVAFFTSEGKYISGNFYSTFENFTFSLDSSGILWVFRRQEDGAFKYINWVSTVGPNASFGYYFPIGDVLSVNESLSVDRNEDLVYVPPGIEAGQGIALDVGAAATMDPDLVLQGVLDDVITGDLTSSMEAAGEVVVDPPVEEEVPDVDNLGLPALGQVLTSRFPFSIPWDFFRAVQLLAAPPKAPYFEVDFLKPIEHRVGGWQGDTTIVLDFAEYEIIGRISRWASTIGFCLMLAGATKRLIWTA